MLGVQGVCIPRGGLCSFEYRGMVVGGAGGFGSELYRVRALRMWHVSWFSLN